MQVKANKYDWMLLRACTQGRVQIVYVTTLLKCGMTYTHNVTLTHLLSIA
jgi:hypothetical protein